MLGDVVTFYLIQSFYLYNFIGVGGSSAALNNPLSTTTGERSIMDKLQREYDRFGPWVAEIKVEDDVPRQFVEFADPILKSDFSFKVPVAAERRDLKPGMVLYETVVSVTGDRLLILHLRESSIDRREVDLKSLQYIQCNKAMLFGELLMVSAGQSSSITFNVVEPEPIEKLERHIRAQYCDHVPKVNLDDILGQEHTQSFLYETLLAQEAKKENLKIVAYQPSIQLKAEHIPLLQRWKVVPEELVLKDTLFLTNGSELIVMSRMQDVKRVRQSDYGYRHTYIPLGNVRTTLLEPNEKAKGVLAFSVVMENSRVVFTVDESFPVDVFRRTLKI